LASGQGPFIVADMNNCVSYSVAVVLAMRSARPTTAWMLASLHACWRALGFWVRDFDGVVEELEVERGSERISVGDLSVSSRIA